jgi:hypothetical protein
MFPFTDVMSRFLYFELFSISASFFDLRVKRLRPEFDKPEALATALP